MTIRQYTVLVFLLGAALLISLVLAGVQPATAQEPQPTPTAPRLPGVGPEPGAAGRSTGDSQQSLASPTGDEILTVPFQYGTVGVQTSQSYAGTVSITVAGVGQASGTEWSDAFYIYTDSFGNPVNPWHPTWFYNFTLWINGGPADSFVQPIPPYNDAHIYNFSIIAPGGPLTFAVGDVVGVDNSGAYTVAITRIVLDIKPGSDPNSINCNNEKGVIPLAILSNEVFDATTVDHTTVTFEGASEMHVDKRSGEPRRHEEDVDYDGDMDLVFHFRLGDTNLTCDSEEGTLTGETFDGQSIQITDGVRMIDRGGGPPFESPVAP